MNKCQEASFLANPDLADILGTMDFDFESFDSLDFLDPIYLEVQIGKILNFLIPRFLDFQISTRPARDHDCKLY